MTAFAIRLLECQKNKAQTKKKSTSEEYRKVRSGEKFLSNKNQKILKFDIYEEL